jgi:hypothetical protein
MLTINEQHHPTAVTDHLYLPTQERRRGLLQVEGTYITKMIKLMEYVDQDHPLMQKLLGHTNINTNLTLFQTVSNFKTSFQRETKQREDIIASNLKEEWEEK